MLVKKLSWMLILVNSTNTNLLLVNKNTKKKYYQFTSIVC